MSSLHSFEIILVLLAAAVALALVARRLRQPPAVIFVLGGMALAILPGIPAFEIDPDVTMVIFLPPLLQASAFVTVWRDFRANLRPILLLAIGAVVFTTVVAGYVLKLLMPELPWAACMTLGAIISPPDAVSANAILERLRLPRRLVTVLAGESLVNDASGLVLYRLALGVTLGGTFDVWRATATFGLVAAGGVVVGYAFGRGFVWALRRLDETNLVIAASFLVAYASYIAAETIEVSGVLATVTCGLVMGWYQHAALGSRTRQEARATWTFIVFTLEALVFIMIGFSLHGVLSRSNGSNVLDLIAITLGVALATIVARLVWVFPGVYVPRLLFRSVRTNEAFPPPSIPVVIGWAGMRGVVSLAAVLALPGDFPGHDALEFITFGVILVTVLVQAPTLGPLIRMLRVSRLGGTDTASRETRAAWAHVSKAQLGSLEKHVEDPLMGAIAQDLLSEFRDRATAFLDAPKGGAALAEREARLRLRIEALAAGRHALLDLHRSRDIHEHTLRQVEEALDLEDIRLHYILGLAKP